MKERRYWIVVIALCGLIASSVGICINSTGVFYEPVSTDLGIKQGAFSMYETLSVFVGALSAIFIPNRMNEKNMKKYILTGTLLSGISTILMAFSNQIYQFYILGVICGLGTGFYSVVAVTIIINNWFISRHGLVTGLIMAFSGVAGAIGSPLFTSIIQRFGWQIGYIAMGISIMLLNSPAIFYHFSLEPKFCGIKPYMIHKNISSLNESSAIKQIYKCTFLIYILLIIFSFLSTGVTGYPQNFPSYIASIGYHSSIGALTVSLCLIGNIVFKLLFGMISDKLKPHKAVVTMLIINFISLVMLLFKENISMILIGSFLFGSIYSVSAVAPSLIIKEKFGNKQYNHIYPIISFSGRCGVALAISLIGYVFDYTGSFMAALILVPVIDFIIFLSLFFIYRLCYRQRKEYYETKL